MAKCKYVLKHSRRQCYEEAIYDDYCILHADFPKDEMELERKVKEKIERGDFNFEGAKLRNIECSNVRIEDPIIFKHAIVKENIRFNSLDLDNPIEVSEIDFRDAVVKGNIEFYNVNIKGNVYFGERKYLSKVAEVKVDGNVNFSYSKISGDISFNNAKIKGSVSFWWAEILKDIYFRNAQVGGDLIFKNAKIWGNSSFTKTIINNNAFFDDDDWPNECLEIKGNATFIRFVVKGNAFFNSAIFEKKADFRVAEFNKNVDFSNTQFKKTANFKDASFLDRGIFNRIINLNASFEEARLKNVSFRNCDMTNVKFKHAILENCELSTSEWNAEIPEYKEYLSGEIDANTVADTYRRIRQCLQKEGAFNEAGVFYVKEMNMKRELFKKTNKGMWVLYTLLLATSNYGESLKRVVFYFIVLIFAFTDIYSLIFNFTPSNALSFSAINSIALIYNQPSNGLEWVIFAERLIGTFLTAVLIYAFTRKLSR